MTSLLKLISFQSTVFIQTLDLRHSWDVSTKCVNRSPTHIQLVRSLLLQQLPEVYLCLFAICHYHLLNGQDLVAYRQITLQSLIGKIDLLASFHTPEKDETTFTILSVERA